MVACSILRCGSTTSSKLYRLGIVNVQAQYSQLTETVGVNSAMDNTNGYLEWSTEKLIDRVTFLEQQLKEQTAR